MTADTVLSLYQHGALFCAGIVALYLLLKWGTGHIPWLEQPQHAHYATIGIAVLAVFAVPASQGTTPNAAMLLTAAGTLIALVLPGLTASTPETSQKGSARISLLVVLALIAVVSCATLKTMTGAFATCAKADLGQLVKTEEGQVVPLATAVQQAIDGNDAGLETFLLGLAKDVGLDAIDCAVAAYDATHTAVPTAGSAASTAQPAPNPGLVRAQKWIAAQRAAK